MYRRPPGPRPSTPANVCCQKCLKRGHYSYECKEPAQARPYVPRPSRTQQLRDPKLLPKLTEATPNEAENKKGIADAELAKREAERERQRALEARDADSGDEQPRRRNRSASIDSVSAISTDRSASPPPRRRSPSPVASRRRHRSRDATLDHRRSPSPGSDNGQHAPHRQKPAQRSRSQSEARSQSPPRHRRRSFSRDSRSPPARQDRRYRERDSDRPTTSERTRRDRRSPSNSPPRVHQGDRRRSPVPRSSWNTRMDAIDAQPKQQRVPQGAPRERSLSPFSQRLALTKAMNDGR
ncbi:zinc knuckle-domain-containing protein [Verticillium dahliae]|nr:zinc knuckle-domain-containing protein [Verticillium dahliae]